jgi:hypothetical protein
MRAGIPNSRNTLVNLAITKGVVVLSMAWQHNKNLVDASLTVSGSQRVPSPH